MCTVSMVGDHYAEKWTPPTTQWQTASTWTPTPPPSREEFDALKREVEDMKALLARAKAYDEANGEPDCELEEKLVVLRKVAEMVGVNLDDVIGAG